MVLLKVDFQNKMLISREEIIIEDTPISKIDQEIAEIYQVLNTVPSLPVEEVAKLMMRLDQLIEEGIKADAAFASMF